MDAEFRAIRENEREECLDLWCTVFKSDSRAYFRRYFYGDVDWLPYYTQVAVVDGKLVSAVQICKRVVACGDFRLTMGGIANVVTLPEYRGHHYNTGCLRHAIAVMEADAMDFSLLWTGINAFYARVGFATMPTRTLYGPVRENFKPRASAYSVRPATADDLPAIRDIYGEYNRERPFTVQRTEAYWRDWIGISPEKIPATLLTAGDPLGEAQGYVRYHFGDAHTRIEELGVRGQGTEAEEVTAALIENVAARAQAAEKNVLSLEIASEPAVQTAAGEVLAEQKWHTHTGGMVRLLHRENLIRSIAMGLNERWIAAGRPSGALTFETPYGCTRLDANGPFLNVEATEDPTEALPQAAFFGLLFGLSAPEQVTENAALHPLLAALFPLRAATYWDADGF